MIKRITRDLLRNVLLFFFNYSVSGPDFSEEVLFKLRLERKDRGNILGR